METWKTIPGYEGQYEASSLGRIRRIGHGRGTQSGKIRKTHLNNSGYLVCQLWQNNRPRPWLVHRLVALAFLGPCGDNEEANHKNLCKTDNRPGNLEYVSRSENLLHRARAGIGRGEANWTAKLTRAEVLAIRERHASGDGYKRLGKEFGVRWETVRDIVKRRTWDWLAQPNS